jgi:hypothetical protein
MATDGGIKSEGGFEGGNPLQYYVCEAKTTNESDLPITSARCFAYE